MQGPTGHVGVAGREDNTQDEMVAHVYQVALFVGNVIAWLLRLAYT